MESEDRSATGAGTDLPVAGLGGRSYAFVLDWHIRVVAGLAWYAAATWVLKRDFIAVETDSIFWWAILSPSLGIYLLYHLAFEILTAGTPGKRLAGVRIVDRGGRTPRVGALVIRNVLRPVDSFVFYAVGLASVLFTRQAVRLGDLAAGTLLVYANGPDARHDNLSRRRFE
ncbi:MAG: RDD family protein [Gammaproteobacteria bacterium]|nr:RDD family protein [Gammaproteobacteria bacterium]